MEKFEYIRDEESYVYPDAARVPGEQLFVELVNQMHAENPN